MHHDQPVQGGCHAKQAQQIPCEPREATAPALAALLALCATRVAVQSSVQELGRRAPRAEVHVVGVAVRPRRGRAIALLGTLAVLSYGSLAALQIAVLNPRAAMPGKGLGQIYAEAASAGQPMGAWWLLMAVGPVTAVAIMFWAWRESELEWSRITSIYLALVALGAPMYFFASFSPGMALADTYSLSGGDYSPWAMPLYVASGLAVIGLAVQRLWRRARAR